MSTLVRWNPLREMAAMQNSMDRIFDDVWRNARPGFAGNALLLNIHENDDTYTVFADLPGMNADQISVNIHDGTLTISAEIPEPGVDEKTRVLMQERPSGQFTRSITLPQPVDAEKIDANYENGVLLLTLPKVPEVKPRAITVKTGRKK